jgi:predicted membrane metal-binding protein
MLLGDRSIIDRAESVDYQKTGVFHVLVVAGLHVGALAFFYLGFFDYCVFPACYLLCSF